jgi:hypothetical protein
MLGSDVSSITAAAALPPLQAALETLGEPTKVLTFHAAGDAALYFRAVAYNRD